MSHTKPKLHITNRINACRKSFYGLQGAGLCNVLTNVNTASYVWKTAIRPVLMYGLNTVTINKTCLRDLEKIQGRLVKSMVSVHKYCKTTPILSAMNICSIESSVEMFNLELMRNIFNSQSRARSFYIHSLNSSHCNQSLSSHPGLLSRVKTICDKYDIRFLKYTFDVNYSGQVRRRMKVSTGICHDGLSDSVRVLLLSCDPYDKFVLNMLLTPF